MVVIDTCQRHTSPEKREDKTTVCAICVWVVVLAFCCVFLTVERVIEDFRSVVAFFVILPFVVIAFIISVYMIGKAVLNLYKYRRELRR